MLQNWEMAQRMDCAAGLVRGQVAGSALVLAQLILNAQLLQEP